MTGALVRYVQADVLSTLQHLIVLKKFKHDKHSNTFIKKFKRAISNNLQNRKFFCLFFSNGKTQVIYLQLTRKFTFSSVSNQQQHSGYLHLDDVFLPEGEPFRLLLVHEDGLVNGGGKFRVKRLRQVVAGGGSDHGSDSQPEVGT